MIELQSTAPAKALANDPLRLIDVDHIRFYVGNAKQAAFFYAHCFGFQIDQVSDLTTGNREEASYLLTQGNIRLLLTCGLSARHPASQEVARFGDGIKDIAFSVADAEAAWEQAISNGAEPAYEPVEWTDDLGTVSKAGIKTFGRVIHSFVSRSGEYELDKVKRGGMFAPRFDGCPKLAINRFNEQNPCGLFYFDHCVANVELGQMNHWVSWYEHVLNFKLFKHFDDQDISTEYSALMSKVMDSGRELIKIPINEPAEGKKKSQIQEYLEWHDNTPGIQHLALLTSDAIDSVAKLRERGVDFLTIPDTYYDMVWDRVGNIREGTDKVKDLRLLADRDDDGYLLQIFTKPLQDRPTLFFEIICRRGSQSFGKGNFKALFESLEIEQDRRGNLQTPTPPIPEHIMKIKQIHHVAYRCKDAKETVEFYTKHLNMDFMLAISEDRVPSTKEPDPYMHLFLDAGNGNILAFFELPNSPEMGRDINTPPWVQHIAFQLEDEQALMQAKAELEAAGIKVLGPTDHGIIKSIYLFDPNGHRLELTTVAATAEQLKKLDEVKWDMLEEWTRSKSTVKHAEWLHQGEFSKR